MWRRAALDGDGSEVEECSISLRKLRIGFDQMAGIVHLNGSGPLDPIYNLPAVFKAYAFKCISSFFCALCMILFWTKEKYHLGPLYVTTRALLKGSLQ